MKHRLLYIAPHRPGRSPGQRFRFEQFMQFLESEGFEITYSFLLNEWDDRKFYKRGNYLLKCWIAFKCVIIRLFDVLRASRFDYIIVYREAHFWGWAIFEKLLSKSRAALLFDFDDAIWLNDISESNKNLSWLKSSAKTAKIAQLADVVMVGNSFLADYARQSNQNVAIVPTVIDTTLYKYRGAVDSTTVTIGWIGSTTTLKHFQNAIPALTAIKKKYGNKVNFKVIVDVDYSVDELELKSTKWNKDTELEELNKVDIGIMPLPDDKWSCGKCGFKGIQYMALGIATVMSPVGVNTDIIEHGVNGFLASTDTEWIDCLSQLIESVELRRRLGEAARKTINERYSVRSQESNLLNAILLAGRLKGIRHKA
ncbi:MAG: glycosyltransferase family 4 protein [Salinivirgaceae bacterium]|nr:glycosyltransferase family 4 protein [Salinivirgaceae bacterium]